MNPSQRVIVVFWDGFRPDHIRPDLTPNLFEFVNHSARYINASSVYPTVTRPNTASISTGVTPGKHGIHINASLTVPGAPRTEFEPLRPFNEGRIMPVTTLAEAVSAAGKRVAVVGSGTAGMTTLVDPEHAGTTIHATFTWPDSLMPKLEERFGPVPPKTLPVVDTNVWLTDVLLEYVLPEIEPDVAFLMSCEPDSSQHRFGLCSPEALAAIRGNDACLGRVLAAIDDDDVPTTVILVSDHGHTTIYGFIDLENSIVEAGFGDELSRGQIRFSGFDNAVLVKAGNETAALTERIGTWLAAQPWVSGLFSWTDDVVIPGALPANVLWGDQPQPVAAEIPTFMYSHVWTDNLNENQVPGSVLSRTHDFAGFERQPGRTLGPGSQLVSMHGSLSPRDLSNTLVLGGNGVRQGAIAVPAGTIDVAPTVLALLGIPAMPDMDGRVLSEALADGPEQSDVLVKSELLGQLTSGPLYRHWVGNSPYLDTRSGGLLPADAEVETTQGLAAGVAGSSDD